MMKKNKFINLMSLVLAALAAVAIIIACGKGTPDDVIGDFDIKRDIDNSRDFLKGNMKNPDFMSSVTAFPSSSSKLASSSSAKGGSSSGNTSGSSSSNVQGSSSSGANQGSSSSGESPYTLTCEVTSTGTAGARVEISNVTKVKCVAKSNPNTAINLDPDNDFTWSTEPKLNERSPAEGEYSIEVEVDERANACQGLTADCGTFTVSAAVVSSSSRAASSSSVTQQSSSSSAAVSSSSSRPSSSSAAVSSSSAAVSSSSRASSSSAAVSSSSRASSSSAVSSSSAAVSSSSYTLACNMTATTGTVGTAITPTPTVQCNGTAVTSGLTWTPANLIPTAAGNVAVSVSAGSGTCSGKSISCGTIAVAAASTDMTITNTATDIQPGTYKVTSNGCSPWGNKLKCSNAATTKCSVTINGTNYENNSCGGWCELLADMPATPFTMIVNSVSKLSCGN